MQSVEEILGALPLFAELRADALKDIAGLGELRPVPAGTVLFNRGEQAEHLHVLVSGSIALTRSSEAGSEAVVEILDAPDVFMIAAALTGAPYLTSGRTVHKSRVFYIPADRFRALLGEHPEFTYAMLASLGRQYRLLVRQVSDLKLRSTAQRLGCYLLAQAREQGGAEFRLTFDKSLLAAKLGATPEHLSRAFATLRQHGVSTSGSRITIADVPRLTLFAQPDEI